MTANGGVRQYGLTAAGTFTDRVQPPSRRHARHPQAAFRERAISRRGAAGIRNLLGLAADAPLPEGVIERGQDGAPRWRDHALLERKGSARWLIITKVRRPLRRIAYQNRPPSSSSPHRPPELLPSASRDDERMTARGENARRDLAAATWRFSRAYRAGIRRPPFVCARLSHPASTSGLSRSWRARSASPRTRSASRSAR